jgi:hypothetical protein
MPLRSDDGCFPLTDILVLVGREAMPLIGQGKTSPPRKKKGRMEKKEIEIEGGKFLRENGKI